jgi:membrane-bound lytic murein transglycosylase D
MKTARALLALLLGLSAFSAWADPSGPAADPFPLYDSIRPNVDFWTRVFSEWSLGQVVIHDKDFPGLVYEIVDLPGPGEASYTPEQKGRVEGLRQDWERYLLELERKVATSQPLQEIDKVWVLHFATVVGADRLNGAHERVRCQRGLREQFRQGLERSFRYDGPMRAILKDHGVPEDLAYLPHVESSFQYQARSSAGAAGVWQFTRGTGKRYLTISSVIDERLDPIAATRGAARYLQEAYAALGSWPLSVTSYNHGVAGMQRAVERHGVDFERIYREYDGKLFGFASKNFYAEFLAARRIAKNPAPYFPEGYTPQPELDLDSIVLEVRTTPAQLAQRYGVRFEELAGLNMSWLSRSSGHRLPQGTRVWLPKGSLAASTRSAPATSAGGDDGSEGDMYVVRPGDSLSSIAAAHDISAGSLRALNRIPATSNLIRVGQRLRIPAAASTSSMAEVRRHVVRTGDTLIHIASYYGVKLVDLLAANTLTARSTIHPGQILHIPH